MGIQRIDDPILLYSEINENNTRYDYALAAPSEKELHIQFLVLAIVNAIVATACFILILAICCSKKVRTIPFNLYILAMTIPDFLVSFFCLITCAMSAPGGAYVSEVMCTFQAFYLPFGFTANCWMNAVITYQIHKLLKDSHACRRYVPPTRVGIAKQTMAVYLYACILATIGLFNFPWLPHKSYLVRGFACFPVEYDLASALFFWLVFIPALMGLPIMYAAYVLVDIYKRSLLPNEVRRHSLAVYYFRLVLVYFGMWVPFLLLITIGQFVNISPWVSWAGSTWSHLQGLVSALVAIFTKKDIRQAVANLLPCRSKDEGSSRKSTRNSLMNSFFRSAPRRAPRKQAPTSDTRISLALSKASEALQDDFSDIDHDESVRGDEEGETDLENVSDTAEEEICHENSVLKSSLETDALSC
jgi:hypothetical protein